MLNTFWNYLKEQRDKCNPVPSVTSTVLESLAFVGLYTHSEPITVTGDKITFGAVRFTPGPGDRVHYKWEGWIAAVDVGKTLITDQEHIHLTYVRLRRTWSGAFTKQSIRHILCGEFCLVCPELFGVFSFSFLNTRLLKVVEGKIGTWSLPCLLSFPVRSDILHWFLFFPLSVLWFCYLDEVLGLVFNLSSIELSSVRQQTPYRGVDNTETFCLSVPWPKILSLSHREKVKRDIWTKR